MVVYQAVAFDKLIDAGGTTYPWVVRVITERGQIVPYVVKLFTERQTQQQHPVAKEVFANQLAREFDLPVPPCALIEFSPQFLSTLADTELQRLDTVHTGLKFGSQLATDMLITKPGLAHTFLKEYDLGTIFAFDNLIQNLDRGERAKPNLLINDETFLLIDHEQAFPFANDANTRPSLTWSYALPDWLATYRACYKHIFYPVLKSFRPASRRGLFDSFQECLRYADVSSIQQTANELKALDVSTGRVDLITDYLRQTQTQHAAFINLLHAILA